MNLPSNAEDVCSIFGLETKILHATGQLTLTPQLLSPYALEPMLCDKNLRAATGEKPPMYLEKAHTPQQRAHVSRNFK